MGEMRGPAWRISATRSPTSFLTFASGSVPIARLLSNAGSRTLIKGALRSGVGCETGGTRMILRRIREHVAHHNWFAVAIDLAIVVIGVFLGTQASNLNQARIERQQARDYRSMLRDDLTTNLSNLANRSKYYSWVRSEALATLAALKRPTGELGERFLIDAYQASQIQPWALKRNTYDQILSVGAMGNLGSPPLRDEVANYYVGSEVTGANIASVPPYREILRRVMPYRVQQSIRSHCGEKIVQDSNGATQVILPGACTLDLQPETVDDAVRQVHDWPGLALDLNRLLVDLDQKLLSVDLISQRAGRLRVDLERVDR